MSSKSRREIKYRVDIYYEGAGRPWLHQSVMRDFWPPFVGGIAFISSSRRGEFSV